MQDNQNEELKYVSLSEMLKFFQDFGSYDDIQDKTCNTVFEIIETPKRNDVAYENIEKMDGKNFTSYMIFLMAIRNKEVKEIVSKIKYIFEYIANNDSFLDNEHIEEHDVNIIYNDGKLEYDTFSYMIEDMDFKKNLSENQEKLKQEYISIGLKPFDKFKIDLESLANKNETIDLYFENLCAIVDHLFNKLRNEFLIYPSGYKSDSNCNDIYELVENRENIIYYGSKDLDSHLEEFKKFQKDKVSLADLFFIYDYNNYKENQIDLADKTYITKNIKCALTKYHGISKKGSSAPPISYKEFIENGNNYENDKKTNFGYYITERSLRSKIAMMKIFIDKCNYRDLFFI